MKAETIKEIRNRFYECKSSPERLTLLNEQLWKAKWTSSIERKAIVNGLRQLATKKGKPHGIQDFRNDVKDSEVLIYSFFCKSLKEVLYPVIQSDRFPGGFKLLLVDEYVKFFSMITDELKIEGRENTFKTYYHGLARGGGMSIFLPRLLWTKKSRLKFKKLITIKNNIASNLKPELRWESASKVQDLKLIKKLLMDPFITINFRYLVRDIFLKSVFFLSETQIRRFDNLDLPNIEEIRRKKFRFDSRAKENKPYIQYKKNLLYSYFFILFTQSKLERSKVQLRYSLKHLSLAIELNEQFYSGHLESLDDLPFKVDLEVMKSTIKDFYNHCSKALPT